MNNNGNYGRNSQHPDFIKQDLNPNNSYINTNIDELKKQFKTYLQNNANNNKSNHSIAFSFVRKFSDR